MLVEFSMEIRCEGKEWTIYKRSAMPFLPPIGLNLYMDDCEHEVVSVFWSHENQHLIVGLDGYDYDDEKTAKEELAKWIDEKWYEDY